MARTFLSEDDVDQAVAVAQAVLVVTEAFALEEPVAEPEQENLHGRTFLEAEDKLSAAHQAVTVDDDGVDHVAELPNLFPAGEASHDNLREGEGSGGTNPAEQLLRYRVS